MLVVKGEIPAFDPALLSHTLLLALEVCGDAMPEAEYASILGVAASLKKQHCNEVASDIHARQVVHKAMLPKEGGHR